IKHISTRTINPYGDLCKSLDCRSAEHRSARKPQRTRGAMLRAPLALLLFAEISYDIRSRDRGIANLDKGYCPREHSRLHEFVRKPCRPSMATVWRAVSAI